MSKIELHFKLLQHSLERAVLKNLMKIHLYRPEAQETVNSWHRWSPNIWTRAAK
jgi:hypothetical protein